MKKKVPKLKTDKEAEAFLARDLSHLDFSQFKPARFGFEKKDEQINMRIPSGLLAALKARAKARHSLYPIHSGNSGTSNDRAEIVSGCGRRLEMASSCRYSIRILRLRKD